jgi:protein kinase C substrate 80K-H
MKIEKNELTHHRAKCWNGPMRSATVELSCGTTNALLSISEPEKCEYRFRVTSPALCWPLDKEVGVGASGGVKEEL